jgi:hypothetical protein
MNEESVMKTENSEFLSPERFLYFWRQKYKKAARNGNGLMAWILKQVQDDGTHG